MIGVSIIFVIVISSGFVIVYIKDGIINFCVGMFFEIVIIIGVIIGVFVSGLFLVMVFYIIFGFLFFYFVFNMIKKVGIEFFINVKLDLFVIKLNLYDFYYDKFLW